MFSDWRLNFEISPLREQNYTGIAQLTASLADQMLGGEQEVRFFHGRTEVPRVIIEDLVNRRSGAMLEWFLSKTILPQSPTSLDNKQVALYSNRKSIRGFYDFECQFIYDLSTLLTPDYHNHDTVSFYAKSFLGDWKTNDLNFCISEATRADVLVYFPELESDRLITLPLGSTAELPIDGNVENNVISGLILVLGTIEPRKNIEEVLSMIGRHLHLASEYRFVFLGRFGWGSPLNDVIAKTGCMELYKNDKILFPGFVSEPVKNNLLKRAELLIYPSRFEGFGLPVVEALAAGASVLAAKSSSLPEAGGKLARYFDPFLDGDFEAQFTRTLIESKLNGESGRRMRVAWGSRNSWKDTYSKIRSSINHVISVKE